MTDHPYSPEFNAWLMRNDMDQQQIMHEILAATNEAAQEKVDWRELCGPVTITEVQLEREELNRWWNKAIPLGRFLIAYALGVAALFALAMWIGRVM